MATNVNQNQDVYMKYYRCAENFVYKNDYTSATRALICATAELLKIGQEADTPAVKDAYKNKAMKLISTIAKTPTDKMEDMLKDISLEYMGCTMTRVQNEDYVKELLGKVTFDDVAGLDEVKKTVSRIIINPIKYPNIYSKFRKKKGGGFLLYGLPGTGKTMIAKAIANEVNAKFYPIKCSDIVSKWFGESESKIKSIFAEAKSQELSILFFDEFEALGTNRTGGDSAMNRIVPELLAQIQGFEANPNVIVICATNRPWDIDSAFLRPGRLTQQIYVPLPDEVSRKLIIDKAFAEVPLAEDVDLAVIAKKTIGFSGADVDELCDYAKNFAIEREISSGTTEVVTLDDIRQALNDVHSSIFQEEADYMDCYRRARHAQPNIPTEG